MDWAALVSLAGVVAAAVAYGRSRGRLVRAAVGAAVLVGAAWALAAAAVFSGWRDADGFIDCHAHCTRLQDLTGAVFVGAPVAAATLVLLALVAWLRARGARA